MILVPSNSFCILNNTKTLFSQDKNSMELFQTCLSYSPCVSLPNVPVQGDSDEDGGDQVLHGEQDALESAVAHAKREKNRI